ncbi:baseplate J/gp47 family protein [Streptomyces sp. I05A-00742]|uniref:baseplate J/gp47 family protein n=1 Tax=Streptomyces sp. I05A-00742 TaxID=2732853 RepID=UPI001487CA2C|nr:baseplate J/gp47 family protein [Streptomyces sp. I05A-00742]
MSRACGCDGAGRASCAGTPARLPGDPARFRYGAILERLLDRISRARAFDGRPLATLGRSPDDPAVALLAAAAGAHHVLGWTLHRLAVDSTLPGTEDRAALVRLTGMLGHVPRPAIAAEALLAFRVGTLPGAPDVVTVPRGLRVGTVPEQGELPVTFETDAAVEARGAWNALPPLRALALPPVSEETTSVEVEGITLGARAGDRVLVHAGTDAGMPSWLLARVTDVDVAASAEPARTVLTLSGGRLLSVDAALTEPSGPGTVILLGQRAQAFGATAPDITFMPDAVRIEHGKPVPGSKQLPTEWADFVMGTLSDDDGLWHIHLDTVHPQAAPDRVVVLEAASADPPVGVARVLAVRETARTDFGLSARCTLITLHPDLYETFNDKVRETVIHGETARGTLLAHLQERVLPVTDPGPDGEPAPPQHPGFPPQNLPDRFYLAGRPALPPGRRVILTGRTAGGRTVSEAATVLRVEHHNGGAPEQRATLVVFDADLAGRWTDATLTVLGNVVPSSHALTPATGAETVGSGDPAAVLPRFPLGQSPLAHVAAPGPRGYAPAIEARVDDRRYEPADTLYGEGPDSHRFQVTERPDGGFELRFAGRLPSGTGNVAARYRVGGGSAGNLPVGRLSQIVTPVSGVDSVTNPLAAEGGSDAETTEELRTAAPRAVRTLDRVVSLADFEAFAQAYRGVGKASAVELRAGARRFVCLTVATTSLAPPAPGSDLVAGLHAALVAAAPPGTRLRIAGFVDLPMTVALALASDPDLPRPRVEAAVRAALVRGFGRPARPFGTAVHRSQITAAAQGVPGVRAVLLTRFSAPGVTPDAAGRLPCPGPVMVTGPGPGPARLEPARLLSVAGADITFTELTV